MAAASHSSVASPASQHSLTARSKVSYERPKQFRPHARENRTASVRRAPAQESASRPLQTRIVTSIMPEHKYAVIIEQWARSCTNYARVPARNVG